MSAPAAKAFSFPVMTMAPTPSSASKACSAAPSSSMTCGLSALSCFGRSSVMTPTRPFFCVLMNSAMAFFQFRKRDDARQLDALAVGLDGGQGFDLAHGLRAALGEILVHEHVFSLPPQLLFREFPQEACRDARGKASRWNLLLGLDEGERGDDRFLADLGVVVHHRVHSNERAASDDAAVQHGAVADRAVRAHHSVLARK